MRHGPGIEVRYRVVTVLRKLRLILGVRDPDAMYRSIFPPFPPFIRRNVDPDRTPVGARDTDTAPTAPLRDPLWTATEKNHRVPRLEPSTSQRGGLPDE